MDGWEMSKRAAAHELAQKKTEAYIKIIAEIIDRLNKDPFGVDYSAELEVLHKAAPKDRGLILVAEREAFKKVKK